MPYINMSLCKNFQQCLGKALVFLLPSKTPEYEGEQKTMSVLACQNVCTHCHSLFTTTVC